jgi:hypothetical protein
MPLDTLFVLALFGRLRRLGKLRQTIVGERLNGRKIAPGDS